jgi:hypothetical protein
MNKESQLIAEAYALVLEAKKKMLTAKQKELASAAKPFDKITRGDIITLAKKKKIKNESAGIEQAYNQQDEVAAKKIAEKLKGTPNLNIATIKMYVAKYLPMVGKGEKDVDHLTALVHDNLSELGLVEASAGIEDQEEYHCDYAADGCDCDGCEECIRNQNDTVREDKMMCEYAKNGCDCDCGCKDCQRNQNENCGSYKKEEMVEDAPVSNSVSLNSGDVVSWKGIEYKVEDVMGGTFKLVRIS